MKPGVSFIWLAEDLPEARAERRALREGRMAMLERDYGLSPAEARLTHALEEELHAAFLEAWRRTQGRINTHTVVAGHPFAGCRATIRKQSDPPDGLVLTGAKSAKRGFRHYTETPTEEEVYHLLRYIHGRTETWPRYLFGNHNPEIARGALAELGRTVSPHPKTFRLYPGKDLYEVSPRPTPPASAGRPTGRGIHLSS